MIIKNGQEPQMEFKSCTRCGEIKQLSEYRITRQGKYHSSYCRGCESIRYKEYYSKNKERLLIELRHKSRKHLYGISKEEFVLLIEKQKNSCAICGTQEPGGKGNWHVDHDHNTGKVRGLLCHKCNTGLGLFLDDTKILTSAIKYLEKNI